MWPNPEKPGEDGESWLPEELEELRSSMESLKMKAKRIKVSGEHSGRTNFKGAGQFRSGIRGHRKRRYKAPE